MKIVQASTSDSEILTRITFESKKYWGYSAEQMENWRADLTISEVYIEKNQVYSLQENQIIIGYYSFYSIDATCILLDNMFVLPKYIGKGCGKILMLDFLERIKKMGKQQVKLHAEPFASAFYKNFGFEVTDQIESSIPGRFLPVMELTI